VTTATVPQLNMLEH